MAITIIEGFDLFSATVGIQARAGFLISSATLQTGRFGGQCIQVAPNQSFQFGMTLTATFAHGFAMKAAGTGGLDRIVFSYQNNTTNICDLRLSNTGVLKFTRNGTLLGSSAVGAITDSVWCYVEVEFLRSATVGTVNVYVNGINVLSLSGQNTGASDIDTIKQPSQNDGWTFSTDDMYMANVATKKGECRVDTLRPSADTAQKDWTPDTAAVNFSRVNNTTYDGDTSYVASATVAQKDLYDVTDLGFTPVSIFAVDAVLCARKDDATARTIRLNTKSGGTTHNGTTVAPGTSYAVTNEIMETDPNTAAAWAVAAVNAVQIGPEVVT